MTPVRGIATEASAAHIRCPAAARPTPSKPDGAPLGLGTQFGYLTPLRTWFQPRRQAACRDG